MTKAISNEKNTRKSKAMYHMMWYMNESNPSLEEANHGGIRIDSCVGVDYS
jgi:hypothetical protein